MGAQEQPAQQNDFNWKSLTLFLITAATVVVCGLMLWPFLAAITGAIVLAIVTERPHRWIVARQRNTTLAAATTLVLVAIGIIGPATFVAVRLGHHLIAAMRSFQNGAAERGFQALINGSPRIARALQYSADNASVRQAIEKGAGFVAGKSAVFLGGSLTAVAQLFIMLFLLFFLYRDGDRGLAALRSILPLDAGEQDDLFSRLTDTIRATVLGRFVVAGVQGLVAGIGFAFLGISEASLLGILTAICAMVPSFGAFIVWLPVAVYLAATHHWIRALILVAVGSLIISTLDNFLYPVLVGTRLRLHTVPIFLSIIGGIWLFGISGLVLGPIVFAVTESLLLIWHRRTSPSTSMAAP